MEGDRQKYSEDDYRGNRIPGEDAAVHEKKLEDFNIGETSLDRKQ
jgi:hypothetical protein